VFVRVGKPSAHRYLRRWAEGIMGTDVRILGQPESLACMLIRVVSN